MVKTGWVLFVFAFISASSQAKVGESDAYTRIPSKSTIQFKGKEALHIPPRETTVKIEVVNDTDGDGIPNYADWCWGTPKGARVWNAKMVQDVGASPEVIGCAGVPEENWLLFNERYPGGFTVTCSLTLPPSSEDREIPAGTLFTVVDAKDLPITELEKRNAFGLESKFLVRSGGGTYFGLDCRERYRSTTRNGTERTQRGKTVFVPDGTCSLVDTYPAAPARIHNVRLAADVQLAKPVVIP